EARRRAPRGPAPGPGPSRGHAAGRGGAAGGHGEAGPQVPLHGAERRLGAVPGERQAAARPQPREIQPLGGGPAAGLGGARQVRGSHPRAVVQAHRRRRQGHDLGERDGHGPPEEQGAPARDAADAGHAESLLLHCAARPRARRRAEGGRAARLRGVRGARLQGGAQARAEAAAGHLRGRGQGFQEDGPRRVRGLFPGSRAAAGARHGPQRDEGRGRRSAPRPGPRLPPWSRGALRLRPAAAILHGVGADGQPQQGGVPRQRAGVHGRAPVAPRAPGGLALGALRREPAEEAVAPRRRRARRRAGAEPRGGAPRSAAERPRA
ncbi:unnamed protein product, partial [Prorocentrum cordatum]